MAPAAMRTAAAQSIAGAKPVSYWLDDPEKPDALPALTGDEHTDLLVIGGGYSGLWTALIAKERDPDRDVVLIEGHEVGWAASGRNGGFCAASLTHGLANGVERWPDDIAKLEELGERNLDAIEAAVARYGIDCEFERTGEIDVATEPHQLQELREWHEEIVGLGITGVDFLDRDALRAEVDSPTFLGGLWDRRGVAMLHPAKLAWGLKRACLELGVRIHEHTRGLDLVRSGSGMAVRTPYGRVFARRVALGTNIFPSLVKRIRPYTVPVYDYALMTEPLTPEQLASIGWKGRQGLGDSANQFHYFRLSADNRILWGGYDAIYPYGGRRSADLDQRPEMFRETRGAVLHVLSAAFRTEFLACLGRRDRHLLPLHRVLRHGPSGAGRVRRRIHRSRRRLHPLRGRCDARPALRRGDGTDPPGHGPLQADALPAGALRLGRDRDHQAVAGPRRQQRRAPQSLAEGHGQAGPRLRQLSRLRPRSGAVTQFTTNW